MMPRRSPFGCLRLSLWLLLTLLTLITLTNSGVRAEEAQDGESIDVAVSSEQQGADKAKAEEAKPAPKSKDTKAGKSKQKTAPGDAKASLGKSRKTSSKTGKTRSSKADSDSTRAVNTAEGKPEEARVLLAQAQPAEPKTPAKEKARTPPPIDQGNIQPLVDTTTGSQPGFIPDGPQTAPERPTGAKPAPEGKGAADSSGADRGRGRGTFNEQDLLDLLGEGASKGGAEEGKSADQPRSDQGGPGDRKGLDLELPDFAQDQPGQITDQPGKVLAQSESPVDVFDTLLGPTILPPDDTASDIAKHAQDPSRGVEENYARVVVPTGKITGSTEKKQFHIEGGLQIYYNEVVISADTADIDEHNEVAHMYGNVRIDDPQYVLQTDDLLINFQEKRFQASGFVQFKKNAKPNASQPDLTKDKKARVSDYFGKQQFELFCKSLFYNWETKELSALEGVRLVHPSFNGTLERLDYNDKSKVYAMSGTVVLEISSYEWIFVNKLAEGEDEKKARALTDSATKITADRVLYSEESGLAQFYALPAKTVDFIQEKRSIKGVYIEVNDKTKDFYVEGDANQKAVFQQQDGNWLIQGGLIKEGQVSEDLKEALLKQLTAEAGSITYNFDRKRMELRDGVKIVSAEQTVEAGEVIQDETAKFFLMRQNVVVKPDVDGYIYAAQIYMDTENDVFTFVGLVDGKIKSDEIPDLMPQETGAGVEAGAGLGGAGRNSGPAQGIFQNTGGTAPGLTFQPSNRSTSVALDRLSRLGPKAREALAEQQAAAEEPGAEGSVDEGAVAAEAQSAATESESKAKAGTKSRPAKGGSEPGKGKIDPEDADAAEKERNGDTNVAEKDD